MSDFAPPTAFHFSVAVSGDADTVLAVQEVSGLEVPAEVSPIKDGQENRFVHRLPTGKRRANLTLKRATAGMNAPILTWARQVLERGMADAIVPRDLTIALIGEQGTPVARWQVSKAFPLKWSVGNIDARTNRVTIEAIEFAFQTVTRDL